MKPFSGSVGLVCGLILAANAAWAQTVCQYDAQNRRTDRIPEAERWEKGAMVATTFPIQLKNARTGKIVLPLSAGYAEAPLYLRDAEQAACFRQRTWLSHMETGVVEAFDFRGNYLGYEPLITSDLHLVDTGNEGLLPVKNGDQFGFADDKTGQLRIFPRYFAVSGFENGRAKATYSGVVRSRSDTDFIPIYLSDQWFYIDVWGNRLPETPPQDNLHDPRYYDWEALQREYGLLRKSWRWAIRDVLG